MITIERKVQFQAGQHTRREPQDREPNPSPAIGRVPRVSRLMALAIRLDQLLREGVVSDQAELAHLGHVTRARLTQILNLLCLAPDIQEQLLFLPPTVRGRDMVSERDLRPLAAVPWKQQRKMWKSLRGETAVRQNEG